MSVSFLQRTGLQAIARQISSDSAMIAKLGCAIDEQALAVIDGFHT
jgi:hypothetical protein